MMSQEREATQPEGPVCRDEGRRPRDAQAKSDSSGDALVATVLEFVPYASDEELAHRVALLKARDYSASLLGGAVTPRAYDHASDAHEIAGAFVFAQVSPKKLELALRYCRLLVMAAFVIDYLEREEALSAARS